MDFPQWAHEVIPIIAARNSHKEGASGPIDAAVELLQFDFCFALLHSCLEASEMLSDTIEKEDGKDVEDEPNNQKAPEERRQGLEDRIDHNTKAVEEANGAGEAEYADESDNAENRRLRRSSAYNICQGDFSQGQEHQDRVQQIPLPLRPVDEEVTFRYEPDEELEEKPEAEGELEIVPVPLLLDRSQTRLPSDLPVQGGLRAEADKHRIGEDEKGADELERCAVHTLPKAAFLHSFDSCLQVEPAH
mmetsp:Transcript_88893/g.190838  ORF Transcript_88893/g.190838 Transcript_88893/m.190838 type:complete len:247 (+) Transcript_88893:692-1432(+)